MEKRMVVAQGEKRGRGAVLRPRQVIALLVLALLITAACSPYKRIGFQGTLLDANGNPLTGVYDFVVRYYTCAEGPDDENCDIVFTFTQNDVQVNNGQFDFPIGPASNDPDDAPDPAIFVRPLYAEIEVEGETLSPRQPLLGSPYAFTLVAGAVVFSLHEGNGPGGSDETDANYGTLSVVAGSTGTALMIGGGTNGGDLIRACTGALGGLTNRECDNLRFRVQNNGTVTADGTFTGGGADFAEYISGIGARDQYEPGDVMVISASEDRAVELAAEPYSTAVIGVYSTDPAFMGGGRYLDDDGNTDMLPIGIVGIVPVKVSAENGPIRRGDLLTTSSTPGHAMLATEFVPGAILGKAMGELDEGTGVIEVVLLLQ